MCILPTNDFVNQRYPQVVPIHRTQHRQRSHPYYTNDTNTIFYSPAYSATTANGRVSRRNYTTHSNLLSTQFWPVTELNPPTVPVLPRPQLIRHSHTHTMNESNSIQQLNEQTAQLQATLRTTMNTLNHTANQLRAHTTHRTHTLNTLNNRVNRISDNANSSDTDIEFSSINRNNSTNSLNNNNTEQLPALQSIDVDINVSPEPIPQHSRSSSIDETQNQTNDNDSDTDNRAHVTTPNVSQPKITITTQNPSTSAETTADTVSSEA